MAVKLSKFQRKEKYDERLCKLLDDYGQVLIAVADNVGSNQLQDIRKGLRGDSVVLMGKNTLIRRCIRVYAENSGNKEYLNLLLLLVGNVGMIFTKGDLKEVSEEVAKYKVGVPARVGLVPPVVVVVPRAEKVKEFLKDPAKFAVAELPVAPAEANAAPANAAAEKVEEKKEEEGYDEDLGIGLFDD